MTKYELVYAHDATKSEQVIGAEIEKEFYPKKTGESESAFISRIEHILQERNQKAG